MTTWSPTDISAGMVLSNGNLTATSTNTSDKGVRSTGGHTTGKYYVEFTIVGTLGGADTGMGIATPSAILSSIGSTVVGGAVIFAGTGNIYFNGTYTGTSILGGTGSTGVGTVWGMAVDLVNSTIWWRINNGNWNGNVANDPASNVGGINIAGLFPSNEAFVLFCANFTSAAVGVNFGASVYSFTPPTGFSSWDPVVTPGNFSINVPLINGQAVGTMVATNSPTTWSFTAGNVGGFYAINNSGAITVTAAGAAGLTVGSEVLTVQACNGAPATFDPATANATLSNGNLTATISTANGGARVFPALAQSSGKYYFEVTWSVVSGFLLGGTIGVALTSDAYNPIEAFSVGTTLNKGNFTAAGQIWAGGAYTNFHLGGTGIGGPFIANGYVIGIAVDLNNKKAWFKVVTPSFLGNLWNGNASADPVANVNGVAVETGSVTPVVTFGTGSDVYIANFGATSFVGTVPSGYSAWPATLACGTAPATINVVASAPVVNPASFTDFLPVSTTELVGVVTASNFPTSWAIIAGDPGGFYAIDNNGAITITSAGDAGIVAGIVTLTVRASNAGGSGTGSVQITTVAEAVAQYRLLVPHYLAFGYTMAGTIVTEGVEIPSGWVPTIAVEPLNTTAIHNYWNAGPPAGAEYGEDYYIFTPAQKPAVFWQPLGPLGYFQLTGAGATFGARTSG